MLRLIIVLVSCMFVSCTSLKSGGIANTANKKVGTFYKKGQKARCADFVSHVLNENGIDFKSNVAQDFRKVGRKVSNYDSLRDGDIALFAGTYNGPNYITHVGIYDNGYLIHRPTFSAPVKKVKFESYEDHFVEARRL